jgi:hypothetical protein
MTTIHLATDQDMSSITSQNLERISQRPFLYIPPRIR